MSRVPSLAASGTVVSNLWWNYLSQLSEVHTDQTVSSASSHDNPVHNFTQMNMCNEFIRNWKVSYNWGKFVCVLFRFLRSVGVVDTVPARKFLEAAKQADDRMLFYTVFKFFETRNMKLKQSPRFAPGRWGWACHVQSGAIKTRFSILWYSILFYSDWCRT